MPPAVAAWLLYIRAESGGTHVLRDVLTVVFLGVLVADVMVPPLMYLLLQLADRADRRLGWGRYHPGQPTPPREPAPLVKRLRRDVVRRAGVGAALLLAAGLLFALVLYAIFGGDPVIFALYAVLLVPLFVLLAVMPAAFTVYLAERASIRRRYEMLSRRAPSAT